MLNNLKVPIKKVPGKKGACNRQVYTIKKEDVSILVNLCVMASGKDVVDLFKQCNLIKRTASEKKADQLKNRAMTFKTPTMIIEE